MEETSSEALASYELPTSLPTGLNADNLEQRVRSNDHVISRTLIAAARNGRLRYLQADDIHAPFAARTLLPCWVGLELSGYRCLESWNGAARLLRPCLSHASLWLGASGLDSRSLRTLTGREVQALRSVRTVADEPCIAGTTLCFPAIDKYLAWLEQDAGLAGQVATAWNAVVEHGDADVVKCNCDRCEARWLSVQA